MVYTGDTKYCYVQCVHNFYCGAYPVSFYIEVNLHGSVHYRVCCNVCCSETKFTVMHNLYYGVQLGCTTCFLLALHVVKLVVYKLWCITCDVERMVYNL